MTINFPHLPYFTLILLPWFDQNEIAAKVIEIAAWRFFPEIRVWGAFGDAVSRFTISQILLFVRRDFHHFYSSLSGSTPVCLSSIDSLLLCFFLIHSMSNLIRSNFEMIRQSVLTFTKVPDVHFQTFLYFSP